MKKRKTNKFTAAGILAGTMAMAGSLFTACHNQAETVYGPPEYFDPDPGANIPEDVYGPPEYFDPEVENPEDFEYEIEEVEEIQEGEDGEGAEAVSPAGGGASKQGGQSQQDPVPSYGPEENVAEPVYGPPQDFVPPLDPSINPEDNIPETVYGPPEWFEGDEPEIPEGSDTVLPEEEPEVQPAENGNTAGSTKKDKKDKKSGSGDEKTAEEQPEPAIFPQPDPFDPAINGNICVYAPPEYFNPDWKEPEPIKIDEPLIPEEPVPEYKPDENRNILVYGPPEYFERNRKDGDAGAFPIFEKPAVKTGEDQ